MALRRVKFVWGGSKVIKGKWFFGLFGLYDRQEGEREDGLAVSVRGALIWGGCLAVAGYAAAAAFLFSFWQRNPYCLLTYSDAFFYPVRRAEVRAKKGQAFIAEGQDFVKQQKWLDGSRLLGQGLALFPHDLNARLSLARFYLLINQRTESLKVLKEGMTDDYPGRTYLKVYFEAAAQGEDYDFVVTTVDRYIARLKGLEAARETPWLSAQKFSALLAAQRGAEALAWAEAEPEGSTSTEHRVLALLELKRAGEALDFLEAWSRRPSADLRLVRRLQVRALRDAGRVEEMERAVEELRRLSPTEPQPLVYGVVQRVLAGREDLARKAIGDYLFRFGGTPANLQLIAEPLAEVGSVPLFEMIRTAATERGYPMQLYRMLAVQLAVKNGEWAGAARELALIKPAPGTRAWGAREQLWYEWMSRLVAAVTPNSDVGVSALLDFFRSRPWLLSMFKPSITALRAAGRAEAARDLVLQAETSFPNSAWLKAEKAQIFDEVATKQSVAAPAALPPAAKPAISIPVAAKKQPAAAPEPAKPLLGEADFTRGLTAAVRDSQWLELRRLLAEARGLLPKPEWLDRRDGEIRLAELRMAQAEGDKPGLLLAVRFYLNGGVDRANSLLAVAREYHGQGEPATAIMLVQEVLRSIPNHGIAKRTLAEWQASPATK